MFALVHPDSLVLETQPETFPVHAAMKWVDIGDNPQGIGRGWRHNGQQFTPPDITQPPTRVPQLSINGLADLLVEKRVLTQADVDGKKK